MVRTQREECSLFGFLFREICRVVPERVCKACQCGGDVSSMCKSVTISENVVMHLEVLREESMILERRWAGPGLSSNLLQQLANTLTWRFSPTPGRSISVLMPNGLRRVLFPIPVIG